MTDAPYTRDILRLAAEVPHRSGFDFEGVEKRSRQCGSRARVAVVLDGEGRVASLTQAVEACAFGQAAAALMGQSATGKSREEVAAAVEGIARWLAGDHSASTIWPGLELLEPVLQRPGRHPAILLPFQALEAAIEEAAR